MFSKVTETKVWGSSISYLRPLHWLPWPVKLVQSNWFRVPSIHSTCVHMPSVTGMLPVQPKRTCYSCHCQTISERVHNRTRWPPFPAVGADSIYTQMVWSYLFCCGLSTDRNNTTLLMDGYCTLHSNLAARHDSSAPRVNRSEFSSHLKALVSNIAQTKSLLLLMLNF